MTDSAVSFSVVLTQCHCQSESVVVTDSAVSLSAVVTDSAVSLSLSSGD